MSDPLSSTEGSGGVTATAPLHSYGEKFEELFPYYLSLGMTEEQYWDKDCRLVIFIGKRKNSERAEKTKKCGYRVRISTKLCPVCHLCSMLLPKGYKTCAVLV